MRAFDAPAASRSFRTLFVSALAVVAVLSGSAVAETPLENATRNDGVLGIPKDDKKMAAAMRKAQATLSGFLALAKAPKPSTSGFTVKVPLRAGDHNEYVWLQPFRVDPNGRITGVLNNTPVDARAYRKGQTLTFPRSQVADWGYFDGDRMMGNFTTCVLIEREPRAEADAFKSSYGLTCER